MGQDQSGRQGSVAAALVVTLLSVVVSSCGGKDGSQGDVTEKILLAAHHGKSRPSSPAVQIVKLPAFRGEGAAWSPNGRWIAIPARRGITLRNVKTGARRHIRAPAPRSEFSSARLSWSPDGGMLRYLTWKGSARNQGYWLTTIRSDGSSLRRVPLGIRAPEVTWAPDGWPLVFVARPYAYEIEEPDGPEPPQTVPLGPEPALWTLAGVDERPKSIYNVGREIREPAFSPDGTSILFIESSQRGEWVMTAGADGSSPQRLVGKLVAAFAAWSPGGKKVALAATTLKGDRRQYLYTVAVRGGKLHRLSAAEVQGAPAWSPDGRWIAYANWDDEIKVIHPNGRGEKLIARLPGEEIAALQWSPDGRHLAFMAWPSPPSD